MALFRKCEQNPTCSTILGSKVSGNGGGRFSPHVYVTDERKGVPLSQIRPELRATRWVVEQV